MAARKTKQTPEKAASEASPPTKPVVLSLYSGAGGLDYGFEAGGFKTGAAVEMDRDACETLKGSGHVKSEGVIHRSIFEVPTDELLEVAGRKAGEVDLLIGGPPCQPFSKASYWSKGDSQRLNDPRADTLAAYMRVVEEALPRAFLLENVEGLAYQGKDEGMRLLLDRISEINRKTRSNYQPVYKVLNAADYGAPQRRSRVFLIAARDGTPFTFPKATHRDPDEQTSPEMADLPLYRSAWDAIADIRPDPGEDLSLKGKWADLIPSIPEGENYLWHTERGGGRRLFGWRTRYWSFLLKLAKAKPSWTLQAQPGPAIGPFHWENRRLSVKELARLMTFPDGLRFAGGKVSVQKQLGNGVVSLVAEVLAREIRAQLLGLPSPKGPPKLLPPDRGKPPAPEPVRPVPARLLTLEGNHEAHPGVGKGQRARKRETAQAELFSSEDLPHSTPYPTSLRRLGLSPVPPSAP